MSRKVVLVNISRGLYDHSQNPPQSPFIKGGSKERFPLYLKGEENGLLPFDKGELEGLYFLTQLTL